MVPYSTLSWLTASNRRTDKVDKNSLVTNKTHLHILTLHSICYAFLPMQCYASLGTSYGPVSVCLCPSVTSQSPIETAERIRLVFGKGATLCYKKIRAAPKTRVFPSATLPDTLRPERDKLAHRQ